MFGSPFAGDLIIELAKLFIICVVVGKFVAQEQPLVGKSHIRYRLRFCYC